VTPRYVDWVVRTLATHPVAVGGRHNYFNVGGRVVTLFAGTAKACWAMCRLVARLVAQIR
jgi:hypothetical protein